MFDVWYVLVGGIVAIVLMARFFLGTETLRTFWFGIAAVLIVQQAEGHYSQIKHNEILDACSNGSAKPEASKIPIVKEQKIQGTQ